MPKNNSKGSDDVKNDWHRAPRNQLVDMPFGLRLRDIPKIRREFSIWSIDDSGTPIVTRGASDYFSLVGATVLDSNYDLDAVLGKVSQYDGESKFSKLRKDHPDECMALMDELGNSPVLAICAPKYKTLRPRVTAKNVFMNRIVMIRDAIRQIDRSQHIIILVDGNNFLQFEDYIDLSVHNVIMSERDSCDYRLIQLADAIVGSLGHALLPDGMGTDVYFKSIKKRCVNLSESGGTCTQQNPSTFDRNTSKRKDKKHSDNENEKLKSVKGHEYTHKGWFGRLRRRG